MSKPQFISRFVDKDFEDYNKLLTDLEAIDKGKLDSLTPSERQQYGKVGNSVLEWDDRVYGYINQKPEFAPIFLDKVAFADKLNLHKKIRPIVNRLKAILENWEDTESLVSFDLDTEARSYYQNVKMLASKNVPSAKTIYDDLSSRFNNAGRKDKKDAPKDNKKSLVD
ncbi:hypothetical protein [uncultured Acetobacteroides sp.]|uniref:hypothetical protein n=1 Tax=uncultured Acetobacteroides sp. TaxID=1760811 RepID=UPI0029F47B16|nr:hypothetical protein [uncultured Acetobacteroides sp.]